MTIKCKDERHYEELTRLPCSFPMGDLLVDVDPDIYWNFINNRGSEDGYTRISNE